MLYFKSKDVNFVQNSGDNLDALKLLQETYLGKVKMIYIDPPYNTGNDFIYNDDFVEDTDEYLIKSNQRDETGNRLSVNTDSEGRFHSKWLSMMYSRLKLARNILRDDGVIFISIDDAEYSNLIKICNEIFGEDNFIASLIWEKGRKNDAKLVSIGHEYIIVFAKKKMFFQENKIKWREAKPGAKEIYNEYVRLRRKYGNNNIEVENGIKLFYEALPKNHPSKKHSRYNKVDDNGVWRDDNMSWPGGNGPTYDVIHPITKKPCAVPDGGWRYSTIDKMNEMIEIGKVVFRNDHTEPPIRKTYLVEIDGENNSFEEDSINDQENEDIPIQVAGTYFYRSALQASNELNHLFGKKVFNNPKDKDVLSRWMSYIGVTDNDIVMDFFAGSGTIGHSVIDLNQNNNSSIKFILVQLPEVIDPKVKGGKAATSFLESINRPSTISELTKERIRRVGKKVQEELEKKTQNEELKDSEPVSMFSDDTGKEDQPIKELDIGFRVLKVDSSNMADIYYTPDEIDQSQVEMFSGNIKGDRSSEDLLFQVLLDWGVDLTLPITKETINDLDVFFVDGNALAACFVKEGEVTEEFCKELAKREPLRVVFRDEGFASDSVKINVEQIFKLMSPHTEVKTI